MESGLSVGEIRRYMSDLAEIFVELHFLFTSLLSRSSLFDRIDYLRRYLEILRENVWSNLLEHIIWLGEAELACYVEMSRNYSEYESVSEDEDIIADHGSRLARRLTRHESCNSYPTAKNQSLNLWAWLPTTTNQITCSLAALSPA